MYTAFIGCKRLYTVRRHAMKMWNKFQNICGYASAHNRETRDLKRSTKTRNNNKKKNYESVISTSCLLYIFSLYQIICLLFKRVWIESLYSRLLCYGCCCCCYYYYSFEIFCFHLFHTLALFAKDIYTILCIIEKRRFSSIFRSLRNIEI